MHGPCPSLDTVRRDSARGPARRASRASTWSHMWLRRAWAHGPSPEQHGATCQRVVAQPTDERWRRSSARMFARGWRHLAEMSRSATCANILCAHVCAHCRSGCAAIRRTESDGNDRRGRKANLLSAAPPQIQRILGLPPAHSEVVPVQPHHTNASRAESGKRRATTGNPSVGEEPLAASPLLLFRRRRRSWRRAKLGRQEAKPGGLALALPAKPPAQQKGLGPWVPAREWLVVRSDTSQRCTHRSRAGPTGHCPVASCRTVPADARTVSKLGHCPTGQCPWGALLERAAAPTAPALATSEARRDEPVSGGAAELVACLHKDARSSVVQTVVLRTVCAALDKGGMQQSC